MTNIGKRNSKAGAIKGSAGPVLPFLRRSVSETALLPFRQSAKTSLDPELKP